MYNLLLGSVVLFLSACGYIYPVSIDNVGRNLQTSGKTSLPVRVIGTEKNPLSVKVIDKNSGPLSVRVVNPQSHPNPIHVENANNKPLNVLIQNPEKKCTYRYKVEKIQGGNLPNGGFSGPDHNSVIEILKRNGAKGWEYQNTIERGAYYRGQNGSGIMSMFMIFQMKTCQ
jgi:hypothetical protein